MFSNMDFIAMVFCCCCCLLFVFIFVFVFFLFFVFVFFFFLLSYDGQRKRVLRDEINFQRSVHFCHFLKSARKFVQVRIQIFQTPDWSLNHIYIAMSQRKPQRYFQNFQSWKDTSTTDQPVKAKASFSIAILISSTK